MTSTRRSFLKAASVGAATLSGARSISVAQGSGAPADLSLVRVGTFVSIKGSVLVTLSLLGVTEEMAVEPSARVWKGRYLPLSSVAFEPGDRLMIRGKKHTDGSFIVTEMLVNWDSFSGIVIGVYGTEFVVELDRRNLDSVRQRVVRYGSDTLFYSSEAKDLVVGRPVTVAGLAVKDGSLWGTTVTVFDQSGRPCGMSAEAKIIR